MAEKKNAAEQFMGIVEKKQKSILSKKIPAPAMLKRQIMEKKTAQLALSEMQRFKRAHERLPTRRELEEIAQAVYSQIKEEAKKEQAKEQPDRKSFLEERRKKREAAKTEPEQEFEEAEKELGPGEKRRFERLKRRQEQKPETQETFKETVQESPEISQTQKELEGLSVSDIFSEQKTGKKSSQGISRKEDFSDLEKELASLEADSISKEMDIGESQCPNCKTHAEDIVFCPECGTAFCSHCAKQVETFKEYTAFTCPKCRATFKSKKL